MLIHNYYLFFLNFWFDSLFLSKNVNSIITASATNEAKPTENFLDLHNTGSRELF